MDYNSAKEIRDHVLKSIESFSLALSIAETSCPPDEYQKIKKSIGIIIGKTDHEILSTIYKKFPDLDHISK
tara:strand:+ start:128 stop:340 length:213 start_codon:yes stop_codon:yes gene_type:complete